MSHFNISLLLILFSTIACASPHANYLNQLTQQAQQLNLHHHPEWLALVHYDRNTFGKGYTSAADSANFFLANDGKTNPASELGATLASFFSNQQETNDTQNPQCAFIARYHWLKSQLNFDPERLPEQRCRRFEQWYAAIDPHQVTLVFPAAHINSPSSMFGHTLLRIDTPNQNERSRLSSYAINYAANTNESNGLIFAIKGLTGGYAGQFSIMPYYEKVRQYSDMENRDVWEYQLNLSDAEIRRLLQHVWELGPVHFNYYFFSENCAYMLLTLIDVARPGLNLGNRFNWYAIPNDTVRTVLEHEGLLNTAVFRPSNRTIINHRLALLDATERDLTYALIKDTQTLNNGLWHRQPPLSRARMLELAQDYLSYQLNTGRMARDEAATPSLRLLQARSQLSVEPSPPPPAPQSRPDQGHRSARVSIGAGTGYGEHFVDLSIRPAYHDLLDLSNGYVAGAQINFLNINLRYFPERADIELEAIDIVDIFSISPRNRFFRPRSWKVNTALERLPLDDQAPRLAYTFNLAMGGSWRLGETFTPFAMVETALVINDGLGAHHDLGLGPTLGLRWSPTQRWTLLIEARLLPDAGPFDFNYRDANIGNNIALSRNSALRLQWRRRGPPAHQISDTTASWLWYF